MPSSGRTGALPKTKTMKDDKCYFDQPYFNAIEGENDLTVSIKQYCNGDIMKVETKKIGYTLAIKPFSISPNQCHGCIATEIIHNVNNPVPNFEKIIDSLKLLGIHLEKRE